MGSSIHFPMLTDYGCNVAIMCSDRMDSVSLHCESNKSFLPYVLSVRYFGHSSEKDNI